MKNEPDKTDGITLEEVKSLLAKATKIYFGRNHHCRCGCAGDYAERNDPDFKTFSEDLIQLVSDGEVLEVERDPYFTTIAVNVGDDMCYTVYCD